MDWTAFISFIIITSITPGPNNLICAGTGLNYGYRKATPFILGVLSGVCLLLVLAIVFGNGIFELFPGLENYISWIGAAYMLYIAYQLIRSTKIDNDKEYKPLGLVKGFLLQFLNPKTMLYCTVIASTFLLPMNPTIPQLISYLAIIVTVVFFSLSSWALFGKVFSGFFRDNYRKKIINIILAVLLVYSAGSVVGLY